MVLSRPDSNRRARSWSLGLQLRNSYHEVVLRYDYGDNLTSDGP